ncbi:MAG: excinuclease ABC subunit C, partial [Marinilabiliales bacterium]
MKETMMQYASEQKFEQAQEIKNKISIIDNYRSKSTIVNPSLNNIDVFSIHDDGSLAFVNYLKIINGAVIQAHTVELKKKLEETKEDLLSFCITDIRQSLNSTSKEIIVPFKMSYSWPETKLIVPQKGDKKKLLELSERNAKFHMLEKKKQIALKNPITRETRILETLQKDLRLTELPDYIECFDNS